MNDMPMAVTGWRCATCQIEIPVETPLAFRCPNATPDDPRHVLQIVSGPRVAPPERVRNTFINDDRHLAWAAFAAAHGMDRTRRNELVEELDDAIRDVDGVGFTATPFERSASLSDELHMSDRGGIWVKDETGGVGGSQKARFLFSILLHLRAAEVLGLLAERPPLAIASCGNAALAAATLAKAARWPLDVYVPTWMSDGFGDRLDQLGARVHRSERRADDPPGDPAMLRFRDAVASGAVPFTVQGPENALCLDGGRTLGWEICEQAVTVGVKRLDRVFIQVGGGAFAAAVGSAMNEACGPVPLFAVQTEGCAPFERAWRRSVGLEHPAQAWAEAMTVWENPTSLADGILDDETYDWVGVLEAARASGGGPVIATEQHVSDAHAIAQRAGYDASPTGTAGLAGVLAVRDEIDPDDQIVVVMSGVTR
jgi:threonine synthase